MARNFSQGDRFQVTFERGRDGSPMTHVNGKVSFPERGGKLPKVGETWEVELAGTNPKGTVHFLRLIRRVEQAVIKVGQRFFQFYTRASVKNEFRGRASDPMLLPEDLREKAKGAYAGLFADAEGQERVDRNGHYGFMAEWRLRQEVRLSPQERDLAFIKPGCETFVGGSVSAADLIRHLDGLSPDQCPVCRKELPERTGGFSAQRRCSCGYREYE